MEENNRSITLDKIKHELSIVSSESKRNIMQKERVSALKNSHLNEQKKIVQRRKI
jgi:hypothetical protein